MSAPHHLSHLNLGLQPGDTGLVPYPAGFGYLAGQPAGSGVQAPQVAVTDPGTLATQMQSLAPQQGVVSDLVRVQFGPVDKTLVGQLLASVAGQDSGLVGVPSTFASQRLTQLGLPQHFEDATPQWWDERIAALTTQTAAPSLVF